MSTDTAQAKRPFVENGRVIYRARKAAKLSQERLAAQVGTTRRHMIRLENGEHLPSGALRDRIEDETGLDRGTVQSSDDDEDSPLRRSLSDDLHALARVAALLEHEASLLAARKTLA